MSKTADNYSHSLYKIASIIDSESSPEAILQHIVENIVATMKVKASSLMLLTPDSEILILAAASGLSDWYLRKGPIKVDQSISETLAGNPISILNVCEDERVIYREQACEEGIASILSVPVRLTDRVIGVLRVYTAKPCHFTIDDIYFAETVAGIGAQALDKLKAYDIIRKKYENYQLEMIQWRAELGDEWLFEESVKPDYDQWPIISAGG